MQIRELNLTELEDIYKLVCTKLTLTYDEFENIIYDMRHQNYKMFGIYEGKFLVCYAGISMQHSLEFRQHLYIYELITKKIYQDRGYDREMFNYIFDYAKMLNCKSVVLSSSNTFKELDEFYILKEFRDESSIYIKEI